MLNKSARRYRPRTIYLNGNNRVVSFKLPEETIRLLDRYTALLGFRNRSDLIRTILGAFIYTMERIERENIPLDCVTISIEVRTPNGGVREVIDMKSSVIPFLKSIYEEVVT